MRGIPGASTANFDKIPFGAKTGQERPSQRAPVVTLMAGSPRAVEVRQQLDRILADPAFSGANRRSRFLRYLVEQALEDRLESLKESVIATEVFERAPGYDPQIDSVARGSGTIESRSGRVLRKGRA